MNIRPAKYIYLIVSCLLASLILAMTFQIVGASTANLDQDSSIFTPTSSITKTGVAVPSQQIGGALTAIVQAASKAEVEDLEKEEGNVKDPYTTFIETDTTFELVVPLFDGKIDLEVEEIVLYDENGEQFYAVEVNRDEWRNNQ